MIESFTNGRAIWDAPQTFEVRFVFGEEKVVRIFAMEFVACQAHHGWLIDRLRACILAKSACERSRPQLQVLRNQIVGKKCKFAGSGPRLVAVARIKISSGVALGVSNLDIEVAILRQNIGVPELEFGLAS